MNLFITLALFLVTNILIWFATNYQLVENADKHAALKICLILAIPISLGAFYGTKFGYEALGEAWGVRLLAFGISYAVFPVLTYLLLNESPFNAKTMTCIILSAAIVGIQVFWQNS